LETKAYKNFHYDFRFHHPKIHKWKHIPFMKLGMCQNESYSVMW